VSYLNFFHDFCVSLERTESGITMVKEAHILSTDCDVSVRPDACFVWRDNATSRPRWLGLFAPHGLLYSSLETLSARNIFFLLLSHPLHLTRFQSLNPVLCCYKTWHISYTQH